MRIKELTDTLRHHLHFILVMPLLIILMTWPTFFQIFKTDSFWLARQNIDSNMLFWDAWYLKLLLGGQADFYYTDSAFSSDRRVACVPQLQPAAYDRLRRLAGGHAGIKCL